MQTISTTDIPKFQYRTNFSHLINGYTRRIKPNVPDAITQIILLYHPKMNGFKFKWTLPNIRTLESSSDSDAFDIGLQNHFFLRAKYLSSEGEPTESSVASTSATGTVFIQFSLMSFPLPSNIRSMVLHCQMYCEELNQQYSRICTIHSSTSSHFQNNRNHNHNPIEIPSFCWTIVPTHSLSIELQLNVLQIRAPQENSVDLASLYRPNRNNPNPKSKGIILYNYQVIGDDHGSDNMKFVWNVTNKKTIVELQKQSACQIVSDIYYDMFQFVACKPEGSSSTTSAISFSLRICGVPQGSSNIGVKLELSYYCASQDKVINILSKIRSFGYDEVNNSLFLNIEQNNILTNELLSHHRLKLYCKACIIAKYGINNDIVSMQSSGMEAIKDDADKETKSKFIKCAADSFVWHIYDPLILKQITTKFSSNCGLNSDPFELHDHEWYISIQAVKPNRYLATPSVSTAHTNHKQIKISIDSLGFGSRESMDCKVSICLLQNGLKSTFYQKFPGRYFRDKDDTFLEVNVLSLQLLKKLSIKIDVAIVNHKNDDSLTLKESKQAKRKKIDENVKSWLCDHGFDAYCDVFKSNNINDMKVVKMITKDDMKYIGINKVGDRIRMLREIQLLTNDIDDTDENTKRSTSRKRKQETNHNGYKQPPCKKPRVTIQNGP